MSKSRRRKKRANKPTGFEVFMLLFALILMLAGMDWLVYDAGYNAGTRVGFNQGVEHVVDQLKAQGVEPVTPQKYVPPINKGDRI
jgi:hypothetical protein